MKLNVYRPCDEGSSLRDDTTEADVSDPQEIFFDSSQTCDLATSEMQHSCGQSRRDRSAAATPRSVTFKDFYHEHLDSSHNYDNVSSLDLHASFPTEVEEVELDYLPPDNIFVEEEQEDKEAEEQLEQAVAVVEEEEQMEDQGGATAVERNSMVMVEKELQEGKADEREEFEEDYIVLVENEGFEPEGEIYKERKLQEELVGMGEGTYEGKKENFQEDYSKYREVASVGKIPPRERGELDRPCQSVEDDGSFGGDEPAFVSEFKEDYIAVVEKEGFEHGGEIYMERKVQNEELLAIKENYEEKKEEFQEDRNNREVASPREKGQPVEDDGSSEGDEGSSEGDEPVFLSSSRPMLRASDLKRIEEDVGGRVLLLDSLDVQALDGLADIIWKYGPQAKRAFMERDGMGALTKTMWADMHDGPGQEAAMRLLFALASSVDADPESDVLVGEGGEAVVDTLLFIMQTQLWNEALQETGCMILGCLAAASHTNPEVRDGSLTGAICGVLNAMDRCRKSGRIQEWGLRALFNQCACSRNAESNKRTVLDTVLDSGATGADVLLHSLKGNTNDSVMTEWACRLYWCLTSNDGVSRMISPIEPVVDQVLEVIRMYSEQKDAVLLVEAALGVISNLLKRVESRNQLDSPDTFLMALNLMHIHSRHPGVMMEAYCLIANLASFSAHKNAVAEAGKVGFIVSAASSFSVDDAPGLHEEMLRALLSLSVKCPPVNEAIASHDVLSSILDQCRRHETDAAWQSMFCRLVASISVTISPSQTRLETEVMRAIETAMTMHANSQCVQEAACEALRNVSSREENIGLLLEKGCEMIGLALDAMSNHDRCKSIQMFACSLLLSIGGRAQCDPIDSLGVEAVVKAIRNNLEFRDVLEIACVTLWGLIQGNDGRKERVANAGGIDAVTCAILMHPDDISIQEKACGILASLSSRKEVAERLAGDAGVSDATEVLLHNISSTVVLTPCVVFLKNVILVLPSFAEDACRAVAPVIAALRQHSDDGAFKKEACNFLCALSMNSEDGKAKILALDGVDVLMNTLGQTGNNRDVQDAARGAFTEIALSSA